MWILATDSRFSNLVAPGMFLAGVVLLIVILLRRFYRHYGRRASHRAKSASHLVKTGRPDNGQRALSSAPSEVLAWQVEMHEAVREMKAELDTKMRTLQLLTKEARHEANRLEEILAHLDDSDVDHSG